MTNLSNETMAFLKQYVFEHMNIQEVNEDNIEDVVMFISHKYEDPLSIAASYGDTIDEDLLSKASNAITELTKDW